MNAVAAHTKFSRYNVPKHPPPQLDAVLRDIAKACRTRPIDKRSIRGVCAGANSWYKDKGKADDCYRFLIETGVLLEEDGTCYYDADRAVAIRNAITQRCRLVAATAKAIRLVIVKAAMVKVVAVAPQDDVKPPSEPPPQTERAAVSTTAEVTVPETPMAPLPERPDMLVPPATFYACIGSSDAIEPEFVLFLTSVERDLWESATIQARQIADSKRVGIPDNPERLKSAWGDARIKATPNDYTEALQRFVDAGLIRVIGPSGNDHVAYEFVRDPDLYRVISISTRETYEMSPVYLEVLRAIQNGEYKAPHDRGLQTHLKNWVMSRWPEVSANAVYTKMVSDDKDAEGYGVLHHLGRRYLRSVKGLERFTFISHDRNSSRRRMASAEPDILVPAPKKTEPSMPTPPVTPSVNSPHEIGLEVRIQELEASIQRQQTELTELKLALQRQKEAKREALRQKIAEAARIRQEAEAQEAAALAELQNLD